MSRITLADTVLDISRADGGYTIMWDGESHRVQVLEAAAGRLELSIDDRHVVAYVSSDGPDRWVTIDGRTVVLRKSSGPRRSAGSHDASSELAAPMPGQVRAVNVRPGETVTRGQVLVVLEAMKMEIRLQAAFDGTVSAVNAQVGQTVEREQVLITLQKP